MDRRQNLLDAFKALSRELRETYKFSEEELIAALSTQDLIPATAFATNLTPFETACRYLSEHNKTQQEIAKILGRPPSVIEKTLSHSKQKLSELKYAETKFFIPAQRFSDKTYTFSEHVCLHLKETYALSNAEIARLVNLDQRTVWTLLSRAKGGKDA